MEVDTILIWHIVGTCLQAELNQRLLEIQEHEYKKRIAEEDYKRYRNIPDSSHFSEGLLLGTF